MEIWESARRGERWMSSPRENARDDTTATKPNLKLRTKKRTGRAGCGGWGLRGWR